MSGHLFVPQAQLDTWLDEGRVDIDADGMKVPAETLQVQLEPAFRFVELLEGQDGQSLLTKVKTEKQLRDIGAETCGNSVIVGDVAYEVVPGFLLALQGPVGGPGTPGPGKDRKEEADLLSRFFLEKVR